MDLGESLYSTQACSSFSHSHVVFFSRAQLRLNVLIHGVSSHLVEILRLESLRSNRSNQKIIGILLLGTKAQKREDPIQSDPTATADIRFLADCSFCVQVILPLFTLSSGDLVSEPYGQDTKD